MSSMLTMPIFGKMNLLKQPYKMVRERSSSIGTLAKGARDEERRSRERQEQRGIESQNTPRSMNRSEETPTVGGNRVVSCSSDYSSSNVSMARSTLSQEERRTKVLKFWDKKL